jgi:hypothetical protein
VRIAGIALKPGDRPLSSSGSAYCQCGAIAAGNTARFVVLGVRPEHVHSSVAPGS